MLDTVNTAPTAILHHSLITGGSDIGAIVVGGDLTMTSSVVSDVLTSATNEFGHGVHVQGSDSFPGRLWLTDVLLARNHTNGVLVSRAEATLEGVTIANTMGPNARFGDGISVIGLEGVANTTIRASRILGSERAGVASFGGAVSLVDTQLDCNNIQLVTQTFEGLTASIEDGGGNTCGCEGVTEDCKALSTELEPPMPVDPTQG